MQELTARASRGRVRRGRAAAEAALAALAAALLVLGVVEVLLDDALRASARVGQAVVGGVAAACALAAALVTRRSERWTASLLGMGLLLALVHSWLDESPPLAALPLLIALILLLRPVLAREQEPGVDYSTSRKVVGVASVVLMLPLGLLYAGLGLLAPAAAATLGHLVFLVLLGWTVWQALRRSYWASAGPVLAGAVWFVGLWAGGNYLGWTA